MMDIEKKKRVGSLVVNVQMGEKSTLYYVANVYSHGVSGTEHVMVISYILSNFTTGSRVIEMRE